MNQLPIKFSNFFAQIKAQKAIPIEKDPNDAKRDLFAVVLSGVGVAPY